MARSEIPVELKRARAERGRNEAEGLREVADHHRDTNEERRTVAEGARKEAEQFRVIAEEARVLREQYREELDWIRQEREALRDTAEQARHATIASVAATADVLKTNLAQMQFLEDARNTLKKLKARKTGDVH